MFLRFFTLPRRDPLRREKEKAPSALLRSLCAGCSRLCLPCVKGGGPLCGGGIVFRPTLDLTKRCFLSFTIPQSAPLTAPFTQGSQTGETTSGRGANENSFSRGKPRHLPRGGRLRGTPSVSLREPPSSRGRLTRTPSASLREPPPSRGRLRGPLPPGREAGRKNIPTISPFSLVKTGGGWYNGRRTDLRGDLPYSFLRGHGGLI